jgi:hypothetical protein
MDTDLFLLMRGCRYGIVAVACMLAPGLAAQAADRALLVGVGDYRAPYINDLPGINLDIDIIRKEVAPNLGIRPENIKVLMDSQATLANVDRAASQWLTEGVGSDDQVLIYFSGHGSQIPDENGDEADQAGDEVLVLHDAQQVTRQGRPTIENVLVDDHFNALINKIPSRNILIIVDACHSGTSTKALNLGMDDMGELALTSKSYVYEGMPSGKGSFGAPKAAGAAGGKEYVAISAAADTEESLAGDKGSIFTLGVREVVLNAVKTGRSLTPAALVQESSSYVARKVKPPKVFHPQLSASGALAAKPIRLRQVNQVSQATQARQGGHGPLWERLQAGVKAGPNVKPMPLSLNQQSFGKGEALVVSVQAPVAGYLNIIIVGPDDEPLVLFPNKFNPENRVNPGVIQIPTRQMNFDLPATAPFGPTLVVALLTQQPLNMRNSASGEQDTKGDTNAPFSGVSSEGLRSFEVQGRANAGGGSASDEVYGNQVEVTTCERQPCQ